MGKARDKVAETWLNPATQALLKRYEKDGYLKKFLSYGRVLQCRK